MNLKQLVEKAKQGDATAITQLYNTFYLKIIGVCNHIVNNHLIAEELTNETFVLAFKKLDTIKNPEKFEYWVTRIATNVSLKYKQQNPDSEKAIPLSVLPENELYNASLEEPDTDIRMSDLVSAINELPEGYQKVFKMAVIQNKSHKEISEQLNIAEHSSSSQLSRAKKITSKDIEEIWHHCSHTHPRHFCYI